MSEPLTCDMFAEHLGETFRMVFESGDALDLELTEAEPSKGQPAPGCRPPFALLFRGPLDPVLPQQLYNLQHETMGDLTLFLVPIGPDEQGMRYEAVFN